VVFEVTFPWCFFVLVVLAELSTVVPFASVVAVVLSVSVFTFLPCFFTVVLVVVWLAVDWSGAWASIIAAVKNDAKTSFFINKSPYGQGATISSPLWVKSSTLSAKVLNRKGPIQ
jgi:hypothetical protein